MANAIPNICPGDDILYNEISIRKIRLFFNKSSKPVLFQKVIVFGPRGNLYVYQHSKNWQGVYSYLEGFYNK